jgi:ribonuclease-3
LKPLSRRSHSDGGEAAETFVIRFFEDTIRRSCASRGTLDYKTDLQELCQDRLKQLPEYRIASEAGPDHQKQFTVELFIKGEVYGRGIGRTKKEGEQKAAKEALAKLSSRNHEPKSENQ